MSVRSTEGPRCLPAGHPKRPPTVNVSELTVAALPAGARAGHVGGRHGRGADAGPVIVIDESNTSGLGKAAPAPPAHGWLATSGGTISYAIAALGAAIAASDPPVLCPHADRPAMDTTSGLWTPARENLDVTTVTDNNGAHDIARIERQRRGAGSTPGPTARSRLICVPQQGFVKPAEDMGLAARRVHTAEELADAAAAPSSNPDPHLMDAVVCSPPR